VELGLRESSIRRVDFIEEAKGQIAQIGVELDSSRNEIAALTSEPMKRISLSDDAYFAVRSGTRVTSKQVKEHPGTIPVYSCFREASLIKGKADEDWLRSVGMVIETGPIVTINANGASIGRVFVRDEKCAITDDVIIIEIKHPALDKEYVAVQLRQAIAEGNFIYEAKLFQGRVKELEIEIPIAEDGAVDVEQQGRISAAMSRFDTIRQRISELGEWSAAVPIS
jgi:type I restriction enzyme M protein